MDDEAVAAFGEVIALPTYFHAGDELLELDRHLTVCKPRTWFYNELLDHGAEWMEQEMLDEGEERRAELQRAIDESREEGDADADQLDRAQQVLDATPPWFLLLADSELEQVANYKLPEPNHTPRLRHKYRPWTKPTPRCSSVPAIAPTASTSLPPTYSRDKSGRRAKTPIVQTDSIETTSSERQLPKVVHLFTMEVWSGKRGRARDRGPRKPRKG